MSGYLLAFDFGLAHIGVAVAQPVTRSARGVATLPASNGKPAWPAVQQIIAQHQPAALIVGLPLNMDGSHSEMAANAEAFARALEKRSGVTVHLHDERLTSREAQAQLAWARESGKAATGHELAACLIAESWLAENPNGS